MWKKIALGCALFVVVAALAVAGGFYFFVWRPHGDEIRQGLASGREMIEAGAEGLGSLKTLSEIAELDEEIPADPGFAPPAGGELDSAQVERLLAVERRVRADMGGQLEAFRERYRHLEGREKDLRPGEVVEALRDLGSLALEAKRHQVAAVQAEGFTREEYAWVRRQTYVALGFGDVSIDFSALGDAVRRGDLDEVRRIAEEGQESREHPVVPPANAALVEPHRDELQQWMPLALLGL